MIRNSKASRFYTKILFFYRIRHTQKICLLVHIMFWWTLVQRSHKQQYYIYIHIYNKTIYIEFAEPYKTCYKDGHCYDRCYIIPYRPITLVFYCTSNPGAVPKFYFKFMFIGSTFIFCCFLSECRAILVYLLGYLDIYGKLESIYLERLSCSLKCGTYSLSQCSLKLEKKIYIYIYKNVLYLND